jgi:hypothetical protein
MRHGVDLKPISENLYMILWALGLFAVMASYFELWSADALGIQSYFVAGFAFVTLFHQGFIYSDMHQLDRAPPPLVREYRNWVNSRLERVLRIGIFVALLFGVGILGDALFPLVERFLPLIKRLQFSVSQNGATVWVSPMADLKPNGELSRSLFVTGSICLFALLFLWNLFAIYFRCRNQDQLAVLQRFRSAGSRRRFYINEYLTDARITLFIFLTGISTIYWFMVFRGNKEGVDLVAEVLILFYIIIFSFFLALKLQTVRSRLVTGLDRLAAKISGEKEEKQA